MQLFLLITLFGAMKLLEGVANPYLIYLINTFPIDSNFSIISNLRESMARDPNFTHITKLGKYEEFMQDEIGLLRYFPDVGLRKLKKRRNVSLMVQVESQMYHIRALDVVNMMPNVSNSPLCNSTGPKIARKMHERNLPYEFGCLSCSSQNGLTFFEIQRERDAFRWNKPAAVRDILFLHQHLMSNINDSAQIYAISRNIDEINSQRFSRGRRLEHFWRTFAELRINPDMAKNAAGHNLNVLTVSCRTEDSTPDDETRIIIESDTLLHPNFNSSPKSAPHKERSLTNTSMQDRYRVGDYEVYDRDNAADVSRFNVSGHGYISNHEEWNLRLALVWGGWSCCSACCMEQIRGRLCRSIESHRTRIGYVSFLKINQLARVNISKSYFAKRCIPPITGDDDEPDENEIVRCVNGVAGAISDLDRRLSLPIMGEIGIPVFSTYFHASSSRLILETTLNEYFKYRGKQPSANASRSDSFPYGSLGQYLEVEECGRYNPQRIQCVELEKCHLKQDADRFSGDGLYYEVHHNEAPPPNQFADEDEDEEEDDADKIDPLLQHCKNMDFRDVPVYDQFANYEVFEGASYVFTVDEATFGELSEANWTFSRDELPPMDVSVPCLSQRKFSLQDGKQLVIINLLESDTTQPYLINFVASFLNLDDNEPTTERLSIRLDLMLLRRQAESQVQSQLLLWVGLILIVMLFLISFAVGFNVFNQRKTELKLREEVKTETEPREKKKKRPVLNIKTEEDSNQKEAKDAKKSTFKEKVKRSAILWAAKNIFD